MTMMMHIEALLSPKGAIPARTKSQNSIVHEQLATCQESSTKKQGNIRIQRQLQKRGRKEQKLRRKRREKEAS